MKTQDIRNFFSKKEDKIPKTLKNIFSKYNPTNQQEELDLGREFKNFDKSRKTKKPHAPYKNHKKKNDCLKFSQNQDSPMKFNKRSKSTTLLKNYSYADTIYWTMTDFPWDTKIDSLRRDIFGISHFRPNQKAIINATKFARDTFVCMPTGGGKSLCFQLPAVSEPGFSLVVMPLLSLIYDQLGHLENLGIKALALTGQHSYTQKALFDIFFHQNDESQPKLLYICPEKIEKTSWFLDFLQECVNKSKLQRIVIDEAHCVSHWGRDFRPDYLCLGKIKENFPKIPLMALTATATEMVRMDIVENLKINNCLYFQSSFNRPNLIYEVREKENDKKVICEIANFIRKDYPKQSGIVYCLTTKEADKVASILVETHGIKAASYHAKLPEKTRNSVQNEWMVDDLQVIVATIAFGMGINKPNVRFVIHFSLPKSLENYYQESGRAGRDGKPSHCILFYTFHDRTMLFFLMRNKINKESKDAVYKMAKFCEDLQTCRRKIQLEHFSERFDETKCQEMCDNCRNKNEFLLKDCTSEAIRIVQIMISSKKMTFIQLSQLLAGKPNKKMKNHPLNGILAKWKSTEIEIFIKELLFKGFIYETLVENFGHSSLFLSAYKKNREIQALIEKKTFFHIKILLPHIRHVSVPNDNETCKNVNILKSGSFSQYLKKKEQGKEKTPETINKDNLKINTIKYESTGRIFARQASEPSRSSITDKEETIEKKTKKIFHKIFGYCDEEQYNEIYERLLLIRKKMFNLKRIKEPDAEKDKLLNIDNVFPLAGIEELCRKLPTKTDDLTVDNIQSVGLLPLKQYGHLFLEEINHFIRLHEIKKEEFLFEKEDHFQDEENQIFNMNENLIKNEITHDFIEQEDTFDKKDSKDSSENSLHFEEIESLLDENEEANSIKEKINNSLFEENEEIQNIILEKAKYSIDKNEKAQSASIIFDNNDDFNEEIDLEKIDEMIREYESQKEKEEQKVSEEQFDDCFFHDMMNIDFLSQFNHQKKSPLKIAPAKKNFKRKPEKIIEEEFEPSKKFEEKSKKIFEGQTIGPFKKNLKKQEFL